MPGIFISYRRRDSGGHAGRLKADLGRRYGKSNVFIDIDSIPGGQPYPVRINQALSHSEVALVLIGHDWVGEEGETKRRIDNEADWVRNEVAAALNREDVTVIPILLERASMPSSAELPPDIAPVSEIEACELRNKQWDYDLKSLFGAVWRTAPDSWLKRSLWWLRGRPALVGVGAALVAVAAVAGAIATGGGSGGSHERVCANQVIPPDVRDRLSVAQQTKDPAVEGTVFYGACQGQDWAIAEFPNNDDGVFKETGLSWTRLGSIEAAKCRVPDELLAAWKQGGC